MNFTEKYSKKDSLIPKKIAKKILICIIVLLSYVFISALHYGGFVYNSNQFLHYATYGAAGGFAAAVAVLFVFLCSLILSIIHIIIILFVRKYSTIKKIVNKIAFGLLILLNVFLINYMLAPLSEAVNIWALLDCYVYFLPLILLNCSIMFITLLATSEEYNEE